MALKIGCLMMVCWLAYVSLSVKLRAQNTDVIPYFFSISSSLEITKDHESFGIVVRCFSQKLLFEIERPNKNLSTGQGQQRATVTQAAYQLTE